MHYYSRKDPTESPMNADERDANSTDPTLKDYIFFPGTNAPPVNLNLSQIQLYTDKSEQTSRDIIPKGGELLYLNRYPDGYGYSDPKYNIGASLNSGPYFHDSSNYNFLNNNYAYSINPSLNPIYFPIDITELNNEYILNPTTKMHTKQRNIASSGNYIDLEPLFSKNNDPQNNISRNSTNNPMFVMSSYETKPVNIFESTDNCYTPKSVRGTGMSKEAKCELCSKKGTEKWLKTKCSAYWYHMNYFHGISSITGKPYMDPMTYRIAQIPVVKKKRNSPEKLSKELRETEILYFKHTKQALCGYCREWVNVESERNAPVNVPEIYWWKHAQKCHKKYILNETKN
ncbi:hypothetical protein BB560_000037 [Smittium megazygosporum]|uniref:Transcription regulator Rua1 C-terminal domain-containing protein n=1 Tax=Smittium megazygosporum TaxID=133381 RepID=A0A2T9ZLG9_9FUNG|nr:hypothetical protein BB560_000037 [Smittium megazygosporum]